MAGLKRVWARFLDLVFGEKATTKVSSKHDVEIALPFEEPYDLRKGPYEPMPTRAFLSEITVRRERWPFVWSRRREVCVCVSGFGDKYESIYQALQVTVRCSTVDDAVLEVAGKVATSQEAEYARLREGAAKAWVPSGSDVRIVED